MGSYTYIIILIASVLAASSVLAAVPGGASVTNEIDLGRLPTSLPDNVSVVAGNITIVNLDVQQTTFRWVGLLGNVSGSIALGDSASNTMYQWAAQGNLVFAAATPTVDWTNLTDANDTNVATLAPYLTSAANDAYNETFTGTPESIDSGIFTITAAFATTDSANTTVWKTYSLWDESALVWAGKVFVNGTSYRDTQVDYQMIIPEDGTAGDTTPTTYYLWVENL
jgi:hypothetical protein